MALSDGPITMPREISSRSDKDKLRVERLRTAGLIPPDSAIMRSMDE